MTFWPRQHEQPLSPPRWLGNCSEAADQGCPRRVPTNFRALNVELCSRRSCRQALHPCNVENASTSLMSRCPTCTFQHSAFYFLLPLNAIRAVMARASGPARLMMHLLHASLLGPALSSHRKRAQPALSHSYPACLRSLPVCAGRPRPRPRPRPRRRRLSSAGLVLQNPHPPPIRL